MKRVIAITGYEGRLGQELIKRGCVPLICDVTKPKTIMKSIGEVCPDIIIHCAAKTDVDKCERHKDEAFEVNARGTYNLRECFPGGKIIYISTDYVFDGTTGVYKETDRPSQAEKLCQYGFTKLLGEEILSDADTIVRTTLLYGSDVKGDFVTNILEQLEYGEVFGVTKCLHGTPTYVPHLAEAIMMLLHYYPMPHIINISGSDVLSRYEFALMIASVFGHNGKKKLIQPTNEVGKVRRPRHAGLSVHLAKKIGLPIYTAIEGLSAMKAQDRDYHKQIEMEIYNG